MSLARITTLIAAASSYALVDLDTVKEELGIDDSDTSQDAWLARAINQVSEACSRYSNRASAEASQASFPVETVQDLFYPERDPYPYQVPGGVQPLQLSHWPIADLVHAVVDGAVQNGATVTLASASGITVGMPVGGVYPALPPSGVVSSIPPGTTVAGLSGNVVTLSAPVVGVIPDKASLSFGMSVVVTDPPGNDQLLVESVDFVVDPGNGQLIRLDQFLQYPSIWPPVRILAQYSGGYDPIPDDVIDAALRWITQRYADKGRDPNLKSHDEPGVGLKTWWVGGPPMSGGVPQEIASLLDRYRVPVAL